MNAIKPFDEAKVLQRFGNAFDPGYIYLLHDRGRYKIGKTTNPNERLRAARTWIPDIQIIGIKPFWFHSELEAYFQIGMAMFWYKGEWYDFEGDEFEEQLLDEWRFFDDDDAVSNVSSFTHFMNGTGMNEYSLEWSREGASKAKFLREESFHTRNSTRANTVPTS